MNKSKVSYLLKSDKRCFKCSDFLKINLVSKKPSAILCYRCYKASKRSEQ